MGKTMKSIGRKIIYNEIRSDNLPVLSVCPGEKFSLLTELCDGPWLTDMDSVYTPEPKYTNPTVCVKIEGAMPGDMLAVTIIAIETEDIGCTGIFNSDYSTRRLIGENCETQYKIVRIKDGFIEYSERLKLRVNPMIGVMATAPAKGTLPSSWASRTGGNMDIQEVCAGTTVYLPVETPGALLHVGDTHAIQGDGEIGGIECRSKVILQADIFPKPAGMEWVRLENDTHIMTAAFHAQTEEAFYEAYGEMIRWIASDYAYTKEEAFLLIGQALEARNTQFINPTRSYICKMKKELLT